MSEIKSSAKLTDSPVLAEVGKVMATSQSPEQIKSRLAVLEDRMGWLVCSWCGEAHLRLYHGLCVRCNRDPRGFQVAQNRMPIQGMRIKIHTKKWARTIERDTRDLMPEAFTAELTCRGEDFLVNVDTKFDMPVLFVEGQSTDILYYKSIFDCWENLMQRFR